MGCQFLQISHTWYRCRLCNASFRSTIVIISALQVAACAYAHDQHQNHTCCAIVDHLNFVSGSVQHLRQRRKVLKGCSRTHSRQTKVAAEAADLRLQKAAYRLSSEFADGAHERANIKQNNSNLLQHARNVIRLATSCWPVEDAQRIRCTTLLRAMVQMLPQTSTGRCRSVLVNRQALHGMLCVMS